MSYDLELLDPDTLEVIELNEVHHLRGGTYQQGGSIFASFNITYNYSKHYYRVIDRKLGIRRLYGHTGLESIPILHGAIEQLKDDVHENYWEGTEGNARKALLALLVLAAKCPDGIWSGD